MKVTRRELGKLGLAAGLAVAAGCAPEEARAPDVRCGPPPAGDPDFVVVGSGAAGGPLACNLARAGYRVVLLEAGGDPASWTRAVPALHAAAAEDPAMRWDFFVPTYGDDAQQRRNARFIEREGGVLYPRAGTLGGCTAHNAMITIYPHNADWDAMARDLGDRSFDAENMRAYFERLERCGYAPNPGDAPGAVNPSRHGFHGWLPTNVADAWLAVKDGKLRRVVEAALDEAGKINPNLYGEALKMILRTDRALWDPNDWRTVCSVPEGLMFLPMHVSHGARSEARASTCAPSPPACPDNLRVELDALATRVLFERDRAVGVEYLKGERLYRASARADARPGAGDVRTVRARREVVLAGGVFNSPQLLMLSGIGPRAELERHGIEVRVDRPGVGANLQDRYEIGVVSEMRGDFSVLEGARIAAPDPTRPDPALERWRSDRSGPYATNGVVTALIKRSRPALEVPDLFLFGLVGSFRGYYPGYSRDLSADKRHFTWGVLKAHTRNTAGRVRLRSADPRDRPEIDFRYFDEGSPGGREDLDVPSSRACSRCVAS